MLPLLLLVLSLSSPTLWDAHCRRLAGRGYSIALARDQGTSRATLLAQARHLAQHRPKETEDTVSLVTYVFQHPHLTPTQIAWLSEDVCVRATQVRK
jgi:hypothetical protein